MVTTFKATGHWDGCLRIKSIVRDFHLPMMSRLLLVAKIPLPIQLKQYSRL